MNCIFKYGLVSDVKQGFAKVNFTEDEFVSDWLPVVVRKSKSDKENWQLEIDEHVVCIMDEDCNEGVILGAIHSEKDAADSGEAAGKFRKLFSDGTLIEYDKNSHKLSADIKGSAEIKSTQGVSVEAAGSVEVKSQTSISAEAPAINCKATISAQLEAPIIALKGATTVTGALTVSGAVTAASIATTGGGSITSDGDMTINGKIEATGEIKGGSVKAGSIDLATHKHGGVQTGGGVTGPATP